jgi:hypothetical protein
MGMHEKIGFHKQGLMTDTSGYTVSDLSIAVHTQQVSKTLYYCTVTIPADFASNIATTDIPVAVQASDTQELLEWKKQFHWLPNIKNSPNQVVAPHYLDLSYTDSSVALHSGVAHTKVAGHVYYEETNGSLPFT